MARKKTKATLIMENGSKFNVTAITPKYYVCDSTQFRKGNKAIKDVVFSEKGEESGEDGIE